MYVTDRGPPPLDLLTAAVLWWGTDLLLFGSAFAWALAAGSAPWGG